MKTTPTPATEAVTLQCPACPAAPACPSPVVNMPISGWLPLAVLMGVLWLRSLWRYHKRETETEAAKPARPAPAKRAKSAPPPEPEPQPDEDDPSNYESAGTPTPTPKQFEQAMKSLGYKAGEIKTMWAKVDPAAPLDTQIVQALK